MNAHCLFLSLGDFMEINREIYVRELMTALETKSCADPFISIEFGKVVKNNGRELTSCTFHIPGRNALPVLYMEEFYNEDADKILPASECADSILSYVKRLTGPELHFEVMEDYELAREYLGIKLVNYAKNGELLGRAVHIRIEDMAAVFYCLIENDSIGSGTVTITNEIMDSWQIDIRTLYDDAIRNSVEMLPPSLTGMEELFGLEREEDKTDMYILSNTRGVLGASALLYPGLCDHICSYLQSDLLILPSSIHEVIVLPFIDADVRELERVVTEINRKCVSEEDVLTNSVYFYRRKERKFGRLSGQNN